MKLNSHKTGGTLGLITSKKEKKKQKFTKKDFLNDLYLFYRYFIASNYVNSVPAPHIKKLSRKLMELHNGESKHRLAVSMPPRHSKSSMVTLAFPLWLLFQNPNVNIMIVTGSPKLAEKFGIQLREYVRELGKYFNVYLSSVKQASTHIMFCDKDNKLYKGNIMLASSGGGITGQDADYLILDDPYTGNDSEFTPSALQQKIDWVNRVVEQRIEPHTKYPISDDCPVYTVNKGWITHGELEVGDTVLNKRYRTSNVVYVHPKTWVDNCFVFSNGDKIVSGDDHLWKFHDHTNDTTRLFTTSEIMNSELYVNNSHLPNFKIPSSTKCISLIDAYKVEKRQGNCITVEAKDGMYLVGKNSTPTHNCILHTRWHSADLIGYYKESDPEAYDFIEFPAIQEDGTPLWSERYTIEELLKKKETVGERVFQSIYQQQPIDMTSDYFNMGMLKFGLPEDYDETYTTRCRAWDIASGNNLSKSDFTAGLYMIRFGDYAIIQDLVHGRFGSKNNKIIVNVAETDTPNVHIVIETGVGAGAKLLFQEWKKQLMGYMVSEAQVSGGKSKVDRATPLQNAIEDGKVYVNIQDPVIRQTFYDELSSFPNGAHDDITDATAHAFNFLFVDNIGKARPRPKIGAVFL